MRQVIAFWLFLVVKPSMAERAIVFKKELLSSYHWFPYGLVLIALILAILILAKKSKKIIKTPSQCTVLERIAINHKTKAYIIDYQGQKFLIADNQHSVAIQALQESSNS